MAYQLDPVEREDRAAGYVASQDEAAPAHRGLLAPALTLVVMAAFAGGLWVAYHAGRHAGGAGGAVPLIRADKSPIKVRPKDPGGMKVPDRNMLVYTEAQPTVERLLPPPEKPLPRPAPPPPAPVQAAAPAPSVAAQPPAATAPTRAPTPSVTSAPAAAPPRPAAQPPQTMAALLRQVAGPEAKPEKPKSAAAASAGVRVQLGSLRSEAAAHEEWQRLLHRNHDLLGRLSATTRRADLGERGVYYRILAGPVGDLAAAERLCGELKARSVGCLVDR
jgi:cell division septation protein DedD